MVALPERKIQEMTQLLAILATELRVIQKDPERIVRKIFSMQIVVPGAVSHIYHIQRTLAWGGRAVSIQYVIYKLETGRR